MFAENGYDATSLDAIASESGLTKATLYYHFSSKETIYAAVVTRYLAEAKQQLDEIVHAGGTTEEILERIIAAMLDDTLSPSKRYIHYQERVRVEPEIRQVIRAAQREYEVRLAQVIQKAQEEGEVMEGDPRVLAMLLIGTVGRTAWWYRPDGRVGVDEFRDTLTRFMLDGVLRRKGPAANG